MTASEFEFKLSMALEIHPGPKNYNYLVEHNIQ